MTYSTYTPAGPFVDGGPPGLSAEWANPLEAFIQKLWADTLITSDHAGGLTVVKTVLTTGSIKRIGRSTGSATQTVTHNWGEQADIVLPYYNGSFGTAPTQAFAIKNETTNAFDVVGQSGYAWTVCYIKF